MPVLPYGLRREAGASGTLLDAAESASDLTIPAASNPASRMVSRGAGAVDGRLSPRRARLPHLVSVRLHRADALELPAECRRHARAHPTEAGANRTPLAARPAGRRRAQAAWRFSARRWRVGVVEDGREPSVHDGVRALRLHRSQARRLSRSRNIGSRTAPDRWRRCMRTTRAPNRTSRRTWRTCCDRPCRTAMSSITGAGRRTMRRAPTGTTRRATSCGTPARGCRPTAARCCS